MSEFDRDEEQSSQADELQVSTKALQSFSKYHVFARKNKTFWSDGVSYIGHKNSDSA